MVALDATRRMVCTGWTLYAIADRVATPFRSSSDAGESRLSCSIDYVSGGYQLVWLWQTQYLVTATACEGGSVSPASQWVAEGETAIVSGKVSSIQPHISSG